MPEKKKGIRKLFTACSKKKVQHKNVSTYETQEFERKATEFLLRRNTRQSEAEFNVNDAPACDLVKPLLILGPHLFVRRTNCPAFQQVLDHCVRNLLNTSPVDFSGQDAATLEAIHNFAEFGHLSSKEKSKHRHEDSGSVEQCEQITRKESAFMESDVKTLTKLVASPCCCAWIPSEKEEHAVQESTGKSLIVIQDMLDRQVITNEQFHRLCVALLRGKSLQLESTWKDGDEDCEAHRALAIAPMVPQSSSFKVKSTELKSSATGSMFKNLTRLGEDEVVSSEASMNENGEVDNEEEEEIEFLPAASLRLIDHLLFEGHLSQRIYGAMAFEMLYPN